MFLTGELSTLPIRDTLAFFAFKSDFVSFLAKVLSEDWNQLHVYPSSRLALAGRLFLSEITFLGFLLRLLPPGYQALSSLKPRLG